MAFFDFINQPVGGMQGAPRAAGAQGPVAPALGGLTYADLVKAAIQYGSKPGSSGPGLVGLMPGGAGSQVNAPTAPGTGSLGTPNPDLLAQQQQQSKQGSSVWSILGGLLAGGG